MISQAEVNQTLKELDSISDSFLSVNIIEKQINNLNSISDILKTVYNTENGNNLLKTFNEIISELDYGNGGKDISMYVMEIKGAINGIKISTSKKHGKGRVVEK